MNAQATDRAGGAQPGAPGDEQLPDRSVAGAYLEPARHRRSIPPHHHQQARRRGGGDVLAQPARAAVAAGAQAHGGLGGSRAPSCNRTLPTLIAALAEEQCGERPSHFDDGSAGISDCFEMADQHEHALGRDRQGKGHGPSCMRTSESVDPLGQQRPYPKACARRQTSNMV